MKISSPAFQAGGKIPSKYTCDGEDVSPPLVIEDVPENTRALALIVDDPDVPKDRKPDGLWVHWLVWNMPAETREIPENASPSGVEGTTDFGNPGYGGPCPPDREHRYFFKVYALDTVLSLPVSSTKADLEQAMNGHVIIQAEFIGRYERQK